MHVTFNIVHVVICNHRDRSFFTVIMCLTFILEYKILKFLHLHLEYMIYLIINFRSFMLKLFCNMLSVSNHQCTSISDSRIFSTYINIRNQHLQMDRM